MKLMHFNSSCSFAGICNLLQKEGIDIEDTELALKMKLPYLYLYENGDYLAGASIQKAEYYNIALKPVGFQIIEQKVTKKEVPEFLTHHPNCMLGIRIHPHQKHAVNFIGIEENQYVFLNNHHADEDVPDILKLTEKEFMQRLDEEVMIATVQSCEASSVDLVPLFKQSLNVLEENVHTIKQLCSQKMSVFELRMNLNSVFRMLLLDGLEMMKLIHEENLVMKMTFLQKQLMNALHQDPETVLILKEHFDLKVLKSMKEELSELIQKQWND